MPHAAGSRLLGPENAPDGAAPAHQGSPDGSVDFRAARAAIRAALAEADQRRMDEAGGRRSRRPEARPTTSPTPVDPVAPLVAADVLLVRRRGRATGIRCISG
jgi:hypothetical protein